MPTLALPPDGACGIEARGDPALAGHDGEEIRKSFQGLFDSYSLLKHEDIRAVRGYVRQGIQDKRFSWPQPGPISKVEVPREIFQNSGTLDPWFARLAEISNLKKDWDGYDTEPPATTAIKNARLFLDCTRGLDLDPEFVSPSPVGVGITFARDVREVYLEFYNDGQIYALFSDGGEPVIKRIEVAPEVIRQLISDIQGYLHG